MKLNVKGIEFRYRSNKILDDVDLKLNEGEVLGLVGPNGSGKTTLLKCINKILEPQKGVMMLKGEEIQKMKRSEIAKKVGYVPQSEKNTFPTKVFDTILMGRKPHTSNWGPQEKDLEIVSEIIETLNLEDISMKNINELSGGQKQKVLIGRALAQEAEILILDEPTSNLDLKHQLEVLQLIKKQKNRGTSAVMAIHDLNQAKRYSDKLIMLKDGKIHSAGDPSILNQQNIRDVYGVKVNINRQYGHEWIYPLEAI
ncbi:ABC transporter ATP-binding protein [Methanonatronarchaeum sp. AMET6-2]|uniref:ABC transporter ATP-binding protein n=1 Tax=Methanonatronarchaeum sp. AMET6-2 TaxID=2933293 RepID=UPI001217628B|nr:ABC transporter ATP-binding protein [Methanonatronarchaeum sp. AMET6-2]RZN60297.1 MAG: ABC transporter ATP-binding protein [Methanonatronarchaeia archaeon]UOY10542.1 ABC transporter ATP-binding protein [Methanonatronarchaeum sp. AMET6-2]